MQRLTTTVTCASGLSRQQAAQFIQRANDFNSSIWIEFETCKINAKSFMGVITMEIGAGTELTLSADGPDENEAVTVLADLLKAELS
ncbi:MAG: HPr family phosphocarrier protein [Oscillospiraceae bacterium]|nr:HPr family phosphocarrier protein [Oscillospiraceae bacterium]